MTAKHLYLRGKTWWFVRRVPVHLQDVAGTTHIRVSTKTRDPREAAKRVHRIIVDEERRLEALAESTQSDDPKTPRWLHGIARELRRAVDAGKIDDELASHLLSNARDQHLTALDARLDHHGHPVGLSVFHEEAIKAADEMLQDASAVPFSDVVDEYLTEKRAQGLPASTVHKMNRALEHFAAWRSSDAPLSKVTRRHAGQYVATLMQDSRAESTNKGALGFLSAFWNWAERRGYNADRANPWKGLAVDLKGTRRGSATSDRKRRPWAKDELQKLVNHLPADDIRWQLCVLASYTGMRLNELCHVEVGEVDLAAGFIAIPEGKTDSSVRQVPIHPSIRPLIAHLVTDREDGFLLEGLKEGGLDHKRGHAVSKRIGRLIRTAVTDDPRVVFHSLRNTFINACENTGVPESTTKLIVGHSRQSLTFGLYSPGADLKVLQDAVAKVTYGDTDDLVAGAIERLTN